MSIRRADIRLRDQRYAVVAIETSGNVPDEDAIVAIAVAHLDPGANPGLVFDSALAVSGAPTFSEIAAELWNAFAGRIVAGHAASNTPVPFLAAAYRRQGVAFQPPFLCTMLLDRFITGLAGRSLDDVAAQIGLGRAGRRGAAADAALTAWILRHQLDALARQCRDTPSKLLPLKRDSTSLLSLHRAPLSPVACDTGRSVGVAGPTEAYALALAACVGAGTADAELPKLSQLRSAVAEGQARAIHAQVLIQLLFAAAVDGTVDDQEAERIDHACRVLSSLGWAPSSQ